MNENHLKLLLEEVLANYPKALSISFHSMESALEIYIGEQADILEKYKDIPMMSIDEDFNTSFNYIITPMGSIVIFFFSNVHFVSILSDSKEPNKQLALRMYGQYKNRFESLVENI